MRQIQHYMVVFVVLYETCLQVMCNYMKKIPHIILLLISLISCKKTESKKSDSKESLDSLYIAEKIVNNRISKDLINEITYNSLEEIPAINYCENILAKNKFISLNVLDYKVKEICKDLNENDYNFIKNQLLAKEIFEWKKDNFKNKKVIFPEIKDSISKNYNELWKEFYEKYDCVLYVSKPIFNTMKNKAIIEIQLGQIVEIYLFSKINEKWKMKQLLNTIYID